MSKIILAILSIIIKEVICTTLEEKFINMLPKEDKDKVLSKIALRIGQEITSTAIPLKPEIELTDKDIDKHTDYVVKVLRQAAETFMDDDKTTSKSTDVEVTEATKGSTKGFTKELQKQKPPASTKTDLQEPAKGVPLTSLELVEREAIIEPQGSIKLLNITTLKNETSKNVTQLNKGLEFRQVLQNNEKTKADENDSLEKDMKIVKEALQNKDEYEVKEIGPSNLYLPEDLHDGDDFNMKSEDHRPIPVYNYAVENAYFNPKTRLNSKGQGVVASKFFDYDISLYDPKELKPQTPNPTQVVTPSTVELMTPAGDKIAVDYLEGRQISQEFVDRAEMKMESSMNVEQNLEVLKDMFERDNEFLIKYDWLGSTVDFLAAVDKIITSANTFRQGRTLSPLDMKLVNYVKKLYKEAKPSYKSEQYNPEGPLSIPNVPDFLKEVGRTYHMFFGANGSWEKLTLDSKTTDDEFVKFLIEIEARLSPLHMHINKTNSTYRNQIWFKILKNRVSEEFNKEELLRILLHIYVTNLLDRVERNFWGENELKTDTELLKDVFLIANKF